MSIRRGALAFMLIMLPAACADDPALTPAPPGSSQSSTAPGPSPSGASAEPSQSASTAPDARSVNPGRFLRPGTSQVAVVYGDMNGVAPEEIVVHSRSDQPGPTGFSAQDFLDSYSWDPGRQMWVKVFDATTYTHPGTGWVVLETDGGFAQSVDVVEMVDLTGDGTPELVVGVQASGASLGPLEIWVFSWLSEAFTPEFTFGTERGGELTTNPDGTLTLVAPEYGPDDPGCCPSEMATRVIGYNPAQQRIEVLSTDVQPIQL